MSTRGTLEIVSDPINTKFTNAAVGDIAIYTKSENQKVHIGTTLNTDAAVSVTASSVNVNKDLAVTRGAIRLSN